MTILSMHDPTHFRKRATDIRAQAMITEDDRMQEIMYRLADDYEQLANRIDERQSSST
jgi:hypothetical protein